MWRERKTFPCLTTSAGRFANGPGRRMSRPEELPNRSRRHRDRDSSGRDRGFPADQVDYINTYGTSTVLNDLSETNAIKKLFGPHAYRISLNSTKSMIGHTIGAAGAVEAVVCALTLHHKVLHPTINYENPDPDCDLDYTPNRASEKDVHVALSNSFGFGSNNACLVMKALSLNRWRLI